MYLCCVCFGVGVVAFWVFRSYTDRYNSETTRRVVYIYITTRHVVVSIRKIYLPYRHKNNAARCLYVYITIHDIWRCFTALKLNDFLSQKVDPPPDLNFFTELINFRYCMSYVHLFLAKNMYYYCKSLNLLI